MPSEKNKADVITKVKKAWLGVQEEKDKDAMMCCTGIPNIEELHKMHHTGVDVTLFVARKIDPTVKRDKVRRAIRQCDRCQSINPAPALHGAGEVMVQNKWERLATDVCTMSRDCT